VHCNYLARRLRVQGFDPVRHTADEINAQAPSQGPHNCAITVLIDPSSQHLQYSSLPAATSNGRPGHDGERERAGQRALGRLDLTW
jgi:hypothetical protein